MEGIIDCSTARLRDPKWWRRTKILLSALARRKQGEVDKARLTYHSGLVANSSLTQKSFKEVQINAQDDFYDAIGAIQPWNGRSVQDRKSKEFQEARQAYIDAFGVDPQDPAFKEWEAQAVSAALAQSQETETDEEKLMKRLRSQDSGRRGRAGRRRRQGG